MDAATSTDGYGAILRVHRRRAGMSQEDLAARSGVSPRGIRKIETQQTKPRASTLKLLADALFLGGADRDRLFAAAWGPAPLAPEAKPAHLPAVTTTFLGRDAQLEAMCVEAERGNLIVVDGMGGTGKTTLAVQAARRLRHRYPDGELFVDLNGFREDLSPTPPRQALSRLLRDLGVERIADDADEMAGQYRSALSGRRMVILLDNAASEDQVRPLIPGDSGNLVLITSRHRLPNLDDVSAFQLETLDDNDAVELFYRLSGVDAANDEQCVKEIVARCGRLPLAVRVAAARMRSRPHWTSRLLLDRMATASNVFSELVVGQRSVAATFQMSYEELTDPQREMFRSLGLGCGPEIDCRAAAALAGTSVDEATSVLDQLGDANLVSPAARPGRYRMHDLVRQFATSKAEHNGADQGNVSAVTRMLDEYLASARRAANQLKPHLRQFRTPPSNSGAPLRTPQQALEWCVTEHENLIVAVGRANETGHDSHLIGLVFALWPYLFDHSHKETLAELCRLAAEASRRRDDPDAEGAAMNLLGLALDGMNQPQEAMESYRLALEIRKRIGDDHGAAATLNNMAGLSNTRGEVTTAAELYRDSMGLARKARDEALEAMAASSSGELHRRLGEYDRAATLIELAVSTFARFGNQRELNRARYQRARLMASMGQLEAALELYQQVLRFCREHEGPTGVAHALLGVGEVLTDLGHFDDARSFLDEAIAYARQHMLSMEGDVQLARGHVDLMRGEAEAACHVYRSAVESSQRWAMRDTEAEARLAMSWALDVLGQKEKAASLRLAAVSELEAVGLPIPQSKATG